MPKQTKAQTTDERDEYVLPSNERRRIAKTLHDGILQDLTVAGLRIAELERVMDASGQSAAKALGEWLRGRHAALRDLVTSLEKRNVDTPADEVVFVILAAICEKGPPPHVEIDTQDFRLIISHTGTPLRDDPSRLRLLRQTLSHTEARLQVRSDGATERLIVTLSGEK